MSNFQTRLFLSEGKVYEVQIKKDFHQAACRHEYKKGKYIKDKKLILQGRLNKDITICIKCGKQKRGKGKNG